MCVPAGLQSTTALAAYEQALLAAPDARQASMYVKHFPPPPPSALEDPGLRRRLEAAPACACSRFTARTTYQAEMQPRQARPQPHSAGGRCSKDSAAAAGTHRCRPPESSAYQIACKSRTPRTPWLGARQLQTVKRQSAKWPGLPACARAAHGNNLLVCGALLLLQFALLPCV